jgi:hypothetical protein
MTIRVLDGAAVAKTNAFLLGCDVTQAAIRMAQWQHRKHAAVIPVAIDPPPLDEGEDEDEPDADAFRRRAERIRSAIVEELALRSHGQIRRREARRLPYLLRTDPDTGQQRVWFLAPNDRATEAAMTAHARRHASIYLELSLLHELATGGDAQIEAAHILAEFGSSVYLWGPGPDDGSVMHLAAVRFDVSEKFNRILCNLQVQAYARERTPDQDDNTATAVDVGHGYMLDVLQFHAHSAAFRRVDARKHPMPGISLKRPVMRRSRLYYLLVLSEFARRILEEAGVPFCQEEFQATHLVEDAFIPAAAVARLANPLHVLSIQGVPLDNRDERPIQDMAQYLGTDFWSGSSHRALFAQPQVEFPTSLPHELSKECNYLFLNGAPQFRHGTAWVMSTAPCKRHYIQPPRAYALLEAGSTQTDDYSKLKYRHLMEQDSYAYSFQGLNVEPCDLALIGLYRPTEHGHRQRDPSKKAETVREKFKRSLLELSLKEALCRHKSIPAATVPADLQPAQLTLLATRRLRVDHGHYKQLVSCVKVTLEGDEIRVRHATKSRWSRDTQCALRFLADYPFLQPDDKPIRDGQFWVVDDATGQRLRVWSGPFVPKILLNANYPSMEEVLNLQEEELREIHGGRAFKYYSKSHKWNFLPYYMYIFDDSVEHPKLKDRESISLQDRGEFLRLFVPSAEALAGDRANLSCFRDLMVYQPDDTVLDHGLLEHPLVRIYLHTMTVGLLVAANNSKMSILEKFARLPLEN